MTTARRAVAVGRHDAIASTTAKPMIITVARPASLSSPERSVLDELDAGA
jgi:hypothetical protein